MQKEEYFKRSRFLRCAMLRIAPVEMTGKRMLRIAPVEMTRMWVLGIASVFAKATPDKPVQMTGQREGVIAQAQG